MHITLFYKKLQDGEEIEQGDHFLSDRFIERSLTLNKFHKTTSEYWQRTPATQKGSPFSLKGHRTKYKRQKERQKS